MTSARYLERLQRATEALADAREAQARAVAHRAAAVEALRAEGYSLGWIAQEMGVSKSAVVKWGQDYRVDAAVDWQYTPDEESEGT